MYLESPPPRQPREPDPLPLALRAAVLGLVAAALLGVLVFRLWALQVLHSDQYAVAATQNQLRTMPLPAERGVVEDRTGVTMVDNSGTLVVQVNPATLPQPQPVDCTGIRPGHLRALRRNRSCAVLYRLSGVLQIPFAAVVRQYQRGQLLDPGRPSALKATVTKNQIEYVKERMTEFRGVQFVETYERQYPLGALAPNILGNVTRVYASDLKNPHFRGEQLDPNGTVGRSGVEWTYDRWLRGIDGEVAQSFDATGLPVGQPYLVRAPQTGDTLQLTIDSKLQRVAQNAIAYGIQVAHADGQAYADRGAIVAMNPDTGAIYALASSPTYSPSIYTPPYTGQKWVLSSKNKLQPTLDKASDGEYPAGSTFKPFTAIAAWMSGIIGPGTTLPCTTSYQSPYDSSHHTFMNWGPINTVINLSTALEISCDTFFYRLGNAFYGQQIAPSGKENFQAWLHKLGFGEAPKGFDLLTTAGLVPSKLWKATNPCFQAGNPNPCGYNLSPDQAAIARIWEPGDDINMAIGQGYLLVSPLQEAVAYSALANGGRIVAPHVAHALLDPTTGKPVDTINPPIVRNLHLPPELLQEIWTGLYGATHAADGTSSAVFANFTPTVYGKTGTAEVPQDCTNCSDAWWSGWASDGTHKLVVVAMIQDGGHGGVSAAPAALRVFEAFFHKKITATTGTDVSH